MSRPPPFGSRSTADHVLAGIDLTGKRIIVTGCNSGIGFETMNALAANGATVLGLARSLAAADDACRRAGPTCVPVACDLSDLDSIAAAASAIKTQHGLLDALVAGAGIAALPTPQLRHGVELQFMVNHLGHFALIDGLQDILRDGVGRVVIVASRASMARAPTAGIDFGNLDARRGYRPLAFYGQSQLAAALHAAELSRRLAPRGIAVNTAHPGATRNTGIHRHRQPSLIRLLATPFMRSVQRGAATQTMLAASPLAAGVSGEYWADCRIAAGDPRASDTQLALRLWRESERLIAAHARDRSKPLPAAA